VKVIFAVCGWLALLSLWLSVLTVWLVRLSARTGEPEWMASGPSSGAQQTVTVIVCRCGAHAPTTEEIGEE